jgi:hypothetical protein
MLEMHKKQAIRKIAEILNSRGSRDAQEARDSQF